MNDSGVAVLEKSICVLEHLLNYPDGVPLGVISKELKMSKSTVHRILSTYRQYSYVVQDSHTGFYSLGGRILKYAPFIDNVDLSRRLRIYMQQFTDETGLSTNLAMLEDYKSVTVDTCIPSISGAIRIEAEKGYRSQLYSTASGKVFLSGFSEEELEYYLNNTPLVKIASQTITDSARLKEDLQETAKRGYSIENLENEEHIISLGAPVYDSHGNICAVIATMMLAINVNEKQIRSLGLKLKSTAAQASQALGAITN